MVIAVSLIVPVTSRLVSLVNSLLAGEVIVTRGLVVSSVACTVSEEELPAVSVAATAIVFAPASKVMTVLKLTATT